MKKPGLKIEPRKLMGEPDWTPKHWELPRVPATLNQLLRMHWAKQRREKHRWIDWIRAYSPKGKALGPFLLHGVEPRRVRVEIIVHRSRVGAEDPDNRHGAVKPLVDALVALGWIADDTDTLLELVVLKEKSTRKGVKTEIHWSVAE